MYAPLTKAIIQDLGANRGGKFRSFLPSGDGNYVETVTFASTWAAADTVSLTINELAADGSTVIRSVTSATYTADSATLATIAAGAYALWSQDTALTGLATISVSGAVITVRGKGRTKLSISTSYTTAGSGTADASGSPTQATTASDIGIGSAVVQLANASSVDAAVVGKAPVNTDFSAQVAAWTLTMANGDTVILDIYMEQWGEWKRVAATTYASDADTSGAALVTEANTNLDALGDAGYNVVVAYSAGSNLLTVTADVRGAAFQAKLWFSVDSGSGSIAVASGSVVGNFYSVTSSMRQALLGFTPKDASIRSASTGALVHAGGVPAPVQYNGEICLIPAGTTPPTTPVSGVWVSVSSSTPGLCYASGSSTRVFLRGASHVGQGFYDINGLGL